MTIARCAQAAVLVGGIIGCGGDAKPADTAKPDTTTGVVENLDPPPPPPPEISNMGQMQLLRGAPNDGRCDSTRTSTEKRIILEGDAPVRTITVGVSHTTGRPFVPLYLDVRSKQTRSDGQEENETLYVGFTENGAMEMGRRQYFVSGKPPNDAAPVTSDDAESAKQLALQVLQRCRGS
jgi:hypothetical protein